MYHKPLLWPILASSLPVAGRDGTLENRMRRTHAPGLVHAKTGTIAGVSSLSGFVDKVGGRPMAFSMIMENFPASSRDYRAVQDSLISLLLSNSLPP